MEPARLARSLVLCTLPLVGCSSDAAKPRASIALSLVAPKALIDVDGGVTLYVYEQGDVPCAKGTIAVPPKSVPRVFEFGMAQCLIGGSKRAWCVSGTLPQDPERLLTFYIEGRYAAKPGGFTGCTEQAIDQDPIQIDIKAQPLVEGVKCGDKTIGLGETCDPGSGAGDEACDAAKCQTNEVILSNGKAANRFYRGIAGHKTGLDIRWSSDGHFFGAWADRATGPSGGDGSDEITLRRISDNLISETTPLVLSTEVRLPVNGVGGGANGDGSKRRSGVNLWPSFVPVAGGAWLAVWLRDGKVQGSVQKGNLGAPDAADFDIAATGDMPSAASSSTGDAVIAYADGGNAKSVFRKSDGTLGSPVTLGTIGPAATNRPRVAWVGGDWVVVWGDGQDIKLQRLGSDGTAKGAPVTANEAQKGGVQDQPDVAAFATGEFLVVWRDAAGEVGADIRVQRFDKAGAATGTEVGAVLNDQSKAGDQDSPVVTAGANSAGAKFFLVAWRNATDKQIGGRFVNVGGGFPISFLGATSSEFEAGVGARLRSSPAVACADPSKGFCGIGWVDDEGGDNAADDDRVRVRRVPMPQ
ncbi:MAG: hypothetical protein ACXWUG_04785 [Polyangiales bacterium]